jgi:hypothetical protein
VNSACDITYVTTLPQKFSSYDFEIIYVSYRYITYFCPSPYYNPISYEIIVIPNIPQRSEIAAHVTADFKKSSASLTSSRSRHIDITVT